MMRESRGGAASITTPRGAASKKSRSLGNNGWNNADPDVPEGDFERHRKFVNQ
jgi:hypothetical protein